jgi:hypothetical protein
MAGVRRSAMVAFWDVLALVLVLISIAFVVLTLVLVVGMLWTRLSRDWRDETTSWVRAAIMGAAALLSLILARAVFGWEHPTLDFSKDKADVLTAVGTVGGDVVTATIAGTTLYALILLRKAVSEQVNQLKASAVQNVGAEMLKIDRWMADNEEYILELKKPAAEHTPLGEAVAEVYADLISQVRSQRSYLPREHMEPWENYFDAIVEEWPQLKKYLQKHDEWYLDQPKREKARKH